MIKNYKNLCKDLEAFDFAEASYYNQLVLFRINTQPANKKSRLK